MPNPPFQPLTLSVEEWQSIIAEQDGRLDEDYIPLAQLIRECEAQAQEAASLRQWLEDKDAMISQFVIRMAAKHPSQKIREQAMRLALAELQRRRSAPGQENA